MTAQSAADGRMAMVGVGLDDAFRLTPLTSPLGSPRWSAIGLEGSSTRYPSRRSAPLGGGADELVSSAFFGWHPSRISSDWPGRRVLPQETPVPSDHGTRGPRVSAHHPSTALASHPRCGTPGQRSSE